MLRVLRVRPFRRWLPVVAVLLAGAVANGAEEGSRTSVEAREALAAAERLAALVEKVEARYARDPAFETSFRQSYRSPIFGGAEGEEEAHGTLLVVRPNKMLWNYDQPEGKLGVFDGRTWWDVDPEAEHVTVHETQGDEMLVRLLTGRLDLLTAFAAKSLPEVSEDGELATLELMPREPRDDVDLVVLDVARASGALRRVSVIDPIGSSWTYEFGPLRAADAPPADAFVVEIPEGFTVSHE